MAVLAVVAIVTQDKQLSLWHHYWLIVVSIGLEWLVVHRAPVYVAKLVEIIAGRRAHVRLT